ncbi:hypothetical protein AHAS_Ahas01G0294000 [Arachis hypogaea]
MTWDMGMRRVIVKNDAEEILKSITKERGINQIHCETIREIVKMKQRPWKLKFCHVYREVNRSANWLARKNLDGDLGFKFMDIASKNLETLLQEDIQKIVFSLTLDVIQNRS